MTEEYETARMQAIPHFETRLNELCTPSEIVIVTESFSATAACAKVRTGHITITTITHNYSLCTFFKLVTSPMSAEYLKKIDILEEFETSLN